MRLYAGGKLDTQAEIIARVAIPIRRKAISIYFWNSTIRKSADSINLVDAIGSEDLELEAFCAEVNFKFTNIVVGGSPVMRKQGER